MATPRYSSIFNFLQNPQMNENAGNVNPAFLSAYGDAGSWVYSPSDSSRSFEGWQYTPPEDYRDILSVSYDPGGGEDPKGSYVSSIDWTKLPNQGNTSLGHVSTLMAIGGPDSKKLKDPKLITWDDNYGWVTPQSNYDESLMEAIGPYLAMAGGTALFGGAAVRHPPHRNSAQE